MPSTSVAPSARPAPAGATGPVLQRLSRMAGRGSAPPRVGVFVVATVLLAACSSSAERPVGAASAVSTPASTPAATSPSISAWPPASTTASPSSSLPSSPAPGLTSPTVTGELGESVGASVRDLAESAASSATDSGLPTPAPAVWPPADPVPAAESWTAQTVMLTGYSGPVSPTGLVALEVQAGRVCLVPTVVAPGPARCVLDLDDAGAPVWWAFAPDGASAVVVSGVPSAATVSLLDAVDGTVRTVLPPDPSADVRWSLSSAVWDGDDALLVIPEVTGETGEVLRVDRATGAVTPEITGLAADITAVGPEMWATAGALFLSPTTGPQIGHVWSVDRATGEARDVGMSGGPGDRLVLQGADPRGVSVMACPTSPAGVQSTLLVTQLATGVTRPSTDATPLCSAVAWSRDGAYIAFTVDTPNGYLLQIVHLATGTPVFAQGLGVAAPPAAPMMTWRGDTVVITDTTGTWTLPTLLLTLTF